MDISLVIIIVILSIPQIVSTLIASSPNLSFVVDRILVTICVEVTQKQNLNVLQLSIIFNWNETLLIVSIQFHPVRTLKSTRWFSCQRVSLKTQIYRHYFQYSLSSKNLIIFFLSWSFEAAYRELDDKINVNLSLSPTNR